MIRRLPLLLLTMASPAAADPLAITRTTTIVSDTLGNLIPRALPGSIADYRTRATNPLGNLLKPVQNVVLVENLPPDVYLRVTDLNAGKGPVEFADGSLLGTGLLSSGLTYGYVSLTATGDALEFFSTDSGWNHRPVADADGYDRRIRAIRVTLTGTFAAETAFQLRYRVMIR